MKTACRLLCACLLILSCSSQAQQESGSDPWILGLGETSRIAGGRSLELVMGLEGDAFVGSFGLSDELEYAWFARLNQNGEILWSRRSRGGSQRLSFLCEDGNGGIWIAGSGSFLDSDGPDWLFEEGALNLTDPEVTSSSQGGCYISQFTAEGVQLQHIPLPSNLAPIMLSPALHGGIWVLAIAEPVGKFVEGVPFAVSDRNLLLFKLEENGDAHSWLDLGTLLPTVLHHAEDGLWIGGSVRGKGRIASESFEFAEFDAEGVICRILLDESDIKRSSSLNPELLKLRFFGQPGVIKPGYRTADNLVAIEGGKALIHVSQNRPFADDIRFQVSWTLGELQTLFDGGFKIEAQDWTRDNGMQLLAVDSDTVYLLTPNANIDGWLLSKLPEAVAVGEFKGDLIIRSMEYSEKGLWIAGTFRSFMQSPAGALRNSGKHEPFVYFQPF